MELKKINGVFERSEVENETGLPERMTITVDDEADINEVYQMLKDDENFILVDTENETAKLVIANPLTSKLENGELEIVSSSILDEDDE